MIIKEHNIDLVILHEIRWPESGNLKSNNMTIFYSGV